VGRERKKEESEEAAGPVALPATRASLQVPTIRLISRLPALLAVRLAPILAAALLAGCAVQADFPEDEDAWIGRGGGDGGDAVAVSLPGRAGGGFESVADPNGPPTSPNEPDRVGTWGGAGTAAGVRRDGGHGCGIQMLRADHMQLTMCGVTFRIAGGDFLVTAVEERSGTTWEHLRVRNDGARLRVMSEETRLEGPLDLSRWLGRGIEAGDGFSLCRDVVHEGEGSVVRLWDVRPIGAATAHALAVPPCSPTEVALATAVEVTGAGLPVLPRHEGACVQVPAGLGPFGGTVRADWTPGSELGSTLRLLVRSPYGDIHAEGGPGMVVEFSGDGASDVQVVVSLAEPAVALRQEVKLAFGLVAQYAPRDTALHAC